MSGPSRRRFLTISAAAVASMAAPAAHATPRLTWRGVALGADVSITLDGPEHVTRPALARARLEIDAYEARFSLFRDGSDIARLNRLGSLMDVDGVWRHVLAMSDRLNRVTDGIFDPTIQPLWQAHATGADTSEARARVGWDRVRLPDETRRGLTLDAGQRLSFNGIAQGAATDAVRDVLAAAGLSRVLVDIGETACIGGPFAIGTADPVHGLFDRVSLTDTAVAVSSPSALRLDDRAYHILDPRGRRMPLWSSVAVHADNAALADGLSTAACLMDEHALRHAVDQLDGVWAVTVIAAKGGVHKIIA